MLHFHIINEQLAKCYTEPPNVGDFSVLLLAKSRSPFFGKVMKSPNIQTHYTLKNGLEI